MGPQESMAKFYSEAKTEGIVCQPSALGAEIYLWAFGRAEHVLDHMFTNEFEPTIEGLPQIIPGCSATKST